ncbi:MAG TPA: CHASE3 domain-containing protein [Cytophagaceae bacterium]|jgi:hypothetical protein
MKLSTNHLRITFGVSLVILCSAFVFSYSSIYKLIQNFNSVNHTNEVLIDLEKTLSTMKGAETSVRGAILTDDSSFLEAYRGAESRILDKCDYLIKITSDNPVQTRNLTRLRILIESKFEILQQQLFHKGLREQPRTALTKKGKQIMDEAEGVIEELKAEEHRLLEIRKAAVKSSEFMAPFILMIASILGFVISGASFWMITQDAKIRIQAEKIARDAEKKVRENEAILIEAQELANIGNFELDLKTLDLYWSDQLYRIYGVDSKTEHATLDIAKKLIHPEDREYVFSTMEKITKDSGPTAIDYRIVRCDGAITTVVSVLKPGLNSKGEFDRLKGYTQDITQRKTIEHQLQIAKQNAENANRFKTSFIANMSHEIRTPINAIIGFSNVLAKHDLKTEEKQYLANIISSGQLLLKLIGDILDISKIEEGKIHIENESFHLKEVISSSILPYKYTANEKGLSFNLVFDENLPPYVFGDSARIKQVIINLIGNALKFTSRGGISVQIMAGSEQAQSGECSVKFSVSDTGTGIPKEKQEQIFESFTQADNSTAREFGGSGLGLSIVKELVALMGGQIKIQSPVNEKGVRGSTFYFTLTMKVNEVVREPLSKDKIEIIPFSPGLRVLVAEDNIFNQKLAEIYLKGFGVEVDFANNGQEAINLLQAGKYSMIFMDVQMPVMDGLTATKEIRKNIDSAIPIIGLTANIFKQDIDNCRSGGMDGHLGKPYDEIQLYSTIKKWCSNEECPSVQEVAVASKNTDLSFLKKLAAGDNGIMKDMISSFLLQSNDFIREAKSQVELENWEALSESIHKFKSTLRVVGIDIHNKVNKAEHDAKAKINVAELPDAVDEICKVCQNAAIELELELAQLQHPVI